MKTPAWLRTTVAPRALPVMSLALLATAVPVASVCADDHTDVAVTAQPYTFKGHHGESLRIHGRILVDAGFSFDDEADRADSSGIRAMWAGLAGKINSDWSYGLLMNFSSSGNNVHDAVIRYHGFDNAVVETGLFRPYSGLTNMVVNMHLPFMERSASTTAFRSLRTVGIGGRYFGDRWTASAAVMGETRDTKADDDEGHQLAGRFIAAPILNKDTNHVLHLGVNADYKTPTQGAESARFRGRGESVIMDDFLIDTGTIDNVDNEMLLGGELRYALGSFSVQSEYKSNTVMRATGEDLTFGGGYVTANWVLTGETRKYDLKLGRHGGVKPARPLGKGGSGAFELAARYGTLDLDDGDVTGGVLNAYTVALNWYPNANVKFAANYVVNSTNENALVANDSPSYAMFRMQANF